jgi:hypothetical protein
VCVRTHAFLCGVLYKTQFVLQHKPLFEIIYNAAFKRYVYISRLRFTLWLSGLWNRVVSDDAVGYQRFVEPCCLHVLESSETLVSSHITARYHYPEDRGLNLQCLEKNSLAWYFNKNWICHFISQHFTVKSRVSSVVLGWTTSWAIGVLGFDSRRGLGIFLFTTASRTALGPTQPPVQWVPGTLSLGVKRLGREADRSLPSSAEIKECMELYLPFPDMPSWRGAPLNISKYCSGFYVFCSWTVLV